MKKVMIILSAFLVMSCTNDADFESSYNYNHEEYSTMYQFIETLHESDLFDVASPDAMSYDEMMLTAAPIIMSDTFADTLAEGDCGKVYFTMLYYFNATHPDAAVTSYLRDIIERELY